jgi:hypothetical protein
LFLAAFLKSSALFFIESISNFSKLNSGILKSEIYFFISQDKFQIFSKSKLISKFFKISLFSQIIDKLSFIESKFLESMASFKS